VSAFVSSADGALRVIADLVLSDDNKTVQQRHEKHKTLSLVEVQAAILSGALRTFLGVHESKTLKHCKLMMISLGKWGSMDSLMYHSGLIR
jgi:hypothetical protein